MGFSSRRQRSEPVRQPHIQDTDEGVLFRRSRTLTGSLSSRVEAAGGREHVHLKSPRLVEHELRGHRRKIGAGLAIIAGCVLVTAWLLSVYIVKVQVTSPYPVITGQVEPVIEEYLTTHPLERFNPALNMASLNAYVTSRVKDVAEVTRLNHSFMDTRAEAVVRVPVAQWQINDKVYYVDATGMAFTHAYTGEPALKIKDESGVPAEAQQRVASTRLLAFVGKVVGTLQQRLGKVDEVILPPATFKEVDFVLEGKPYRIKAHIDRDPAGQAADIVAAVQHVEGRGVVPQYLDVRVEGKAYYR